MWDEPFGRVAAEAMINGIPPLVSNRGSLPHVVGGDFTEGGGGRVLPIPDWMTVKTTRLPSEREVEPWYEASARCGTMPRCTRRWPHGRATSHTPGTVQRVSRRLHVEYASPH